MNKRTAARTAKKLSMSFDYIFNVVKTNRSYKIFNSNSIEDCLCSFFGGEIAI